MSEIEIRPENSTAEDPRLEQMRSRLYENQEHYGNVDVDNKTLGTFANAALSALEMPYFYEQLNWVLSTRDDLDASHAIKLLERCYQADLLEHDRENYPHRYRDNIDAWLEVFTTIDTDDERSGKLLFNLLTRRVQSNIAERYKTVKLLASLHSERFQNEPSVLDVGSSELHGSLKLAFDHNTRDELSFGDIALRVDAGNDVFRRQYARRISDIANAVLRKTVNFGRILGTDITDIDDPSTKKWVESCSYYPDEFSDAGKLTEYRLLEEVDPAHERVEFVRADFSSADGFTRIRDVAPDDGFDLVTLSTFLYQVNNKDERVAILRNAARLVSERGLILIQDALDGDFTKPYNYRSLVRDSTRSEFGAQEILRWKTPRCREAIIGLGRLSIGGKLLPFDEALFEISAQTTTG